MFFLYYLVIVLRLYCFFDSVILINYKCEYSQNQSLFAVLFLFLIFSIDNKNSVLQNYSFVVKKNLQTVSPYK
jgi:hypothetical protein